MSTFLDERPKPVRSLSRFLTFALIAVIGVTGLTARLFYLQMVDGGRLATLSTRNRTVLEAIQAPRGVIYDRTGRALVSNVPTFVVKLRPADLPLDQRPVVVQRLSALLRMPVADINASIDGNPGSTFDLVRIASDVDEQTARLISEAGSDLPGVEVVIEARRQYTDGPLMSQILGYTGPVSGEQLAELKSAGYLPDDLIGKAGVESVYETELRGVYGSESVERDASGRQTQVLQTVTDPQPGDSLTLTIDTKDQRDAQKALQWAMKDGRHEAWRRDRHEPADGRDPRAGEPADVRQQRVRPWHQQRRLREAAQQSRQAADQPRDPGALTRRVRRTSSSRARACSRTRRSPRRPRSGREAT